MELTTILGTLAEEITLLPSMNFTDTAQDFDCFYKHLFFIN